MGAAVSGGHSSHTEHSARFRRVDKDDKHAPPSRCRMCQLKVELGAPAYRCSEPGGCAVVLHEACYRRPRTLKRHLGHPNHRLTLGGDTRAGLSCSLCAQDLGTPPVAYSCTRRRCCGFHAHPRCCDLPRRLSVPPELHEHGDLVLRPPQSGGNSNGQRQGRRCIKCQRVATTTDQAAPWSYQCPNCVNAEYCLACLLGDGDTDNGRCCCCQCCTVDPAAVHCLGHLAGVFFCGFLSGMGCPGIPTQPYHGDIELTRYRK